MNIDQATRQLIDALKSTCGAFGLGNDGNEYKIIIQVFLYKYFKIKAVVSLPQLAFEPCTSTKTSILFAQKKTAEEVAAWNTAWDEASKEWQTLKTRVENLIAVADGKKEKSKPGGINDEKSFCTHHCRDSARAVSYRLRKRQGFPHPQRL